MPRFSQNSAPTVFVEAEHLINGMVSTLVGQAVQAGPTVGVLNTNGTLNLNQGTSVADDAVLYRTVALPWTFAALSYATFLSDYTIVAGETPMPVGP